MRASVRLTKALFAAPALPARLTVFNWVRVWPARFLPAAVAVLAEVVRRFEAVSFTFAAVETAVVPIVFMA